MPTLYCIYWLSAPRCEISNLFLKEMHKIIDLAIDKTFNRDTYLKKIDEVNN